MNSAKPSNKKPFYNFAYDFVKVTGAIPMLLWLRPKIHRPFGNKKLDGPVLITANHRSLLDPVIVHLAFPTKRLDCLATKDLYNTKLKAWFFNKMHCIMVDKQNFTLSAFHDVVERLKQGRAVVIFPEGGLNTTDENVLAFKSGATLMASKADAQLLPVYIVKREKWYHRQHIVVGEFFKVECEKGKMPTLEQLNNASEALRTKELALYEYFEARKEGKNEQ